MRAYFFPVLFFSLLLLVPVAPYCGVLLWAWVTMMNPHQIAGGWISTFPLNNMVVVVLAIGLLLQRERVLPPGNGLTIMIVMFMIWCTVTTSYALSPEITAARADLSMKNMLFGLIVATCTRNRVRCQAIVWLFVLSYGYFGVKGGMFTIVTGGEGNVIGPSKTTIEDRNALALTMLMAIPLAYFLFNTSANKLVRLGLICIIAFSAVAVLGTYSRGGLVGLGTLGLYFWWKSSRKVMIMACALAVGLAGWYVLPDRWYERMSSIQEVDSDASFQGREDAWRFAFNAASSRLLGVGFSGTEDKVVFELYASESTVTIDRGRAAHSIFFQVLGDHGFIGLGLFLTILVLAWRITGRLSRLRGEDEAWAAELGKMVRVSLVTYSVVGTALSLAYDSSIFCLLGLLSAMSRLCLTMQVNRQHERVQTGAGLART